MICTILTLGEEGGGTDRSRSTALKITIEKKHPFLNVRIFDGVDIVFRAD